jgi:hypothetical protein
VHTVTTRMRHLYAKLGVHRRRQAVEQARALGLLAPNATGLVNVWSMVWSSFSTVERTRGLVATSGVPSAPQSPLAIFSGLRNRRATTAARG